MLPTLRRLQTTVPTTRSRRHRRLSHTEAFGYTIVIRPRGSRRRSRPASRITQTATIRPKLSASRDSITLSVPAVVARRAVERTAVVTISVFQPANFSQTCVNLQTTLVTKILTTIAAATIPPPKLMSGLECRGASLVPQDSPIMKSKSSSLRTNASSESSPGQRLRTSLQKHSGYAVKMGLLAFTTVFGRVGVWNRC